jgi:DNA-3-methyladenine glycosylase I
MEEKPTSYCEAVGHLEHSNVHRHYHDHEYGFPLADDNALFGRLILEINQAGLSWTTILNKKENFHRAYSGFDIQKVADYTDADRQRLLADEGIIRNRLKVEAAIFNAQKILALQSEYGSFKNWLDAHHPKSKGEWVKLFKKTFRFTGGEITNEFLVSTGYLPGAHIKACPVYQQVIKSNPAWLQTK